MADVRPFKAVRYNGKSDLSKLVTQPYDKISPKLKEDYKTRDAHNLVNILLPDERDGKSKYQVSGEVFREWLKENILKRDDVSGFYPYRQTFEIFGEKHQRSGFIGLVKVEDYSKKIIFPHEKTLTGPKADRLALLKEGRVHYGLIFLLYKDNGKAQQIIDDAMNSSATEGGGIYVNNGGVIKSCLIISNSADSGGGVIVASGGGAYNTTIADNQATTSAGGALCAGEMINNIVYYNSAPADPNLTISVGTFTYGCTTPAKTGEGNISVSPEFTEGYKIDESSPCAGTAVELDWMSWSKDLSGESRLRGNEADMGAYSAVPEPSLLLITWSLIFLLRKNGLHLIKLKP